MEVGIFVHFLTYIGYGTMKIESCRNAAKEREELRMTKKMAKWLSWFLTVCMMVTSLPIYQTAAHAETTDKNEEEQEPQQDTVSGLGITCFIPN